MEAFSFRIGIKGVDKLSGPLSRMGQGLDNVGKKAKRIGKQMSMKLTLPTVAAGVSIFRTAATFERSMNRVEALTGATGDELGKLNDQAKQLGKTTPFSASQAAEGMTFLGMAGFKANQILGAMPGTLQLASAAQMELGESADIVSNVLTGYRMEVSQLGMANDVLVKAFTSSNTDLRQLGEAMKLSGPVAAAMNVKFHETVAVLGLMGSAGFQGSLAGTALRGALVRLAKPTAEVSRTMAKLGIDRDRILDSENNVRSLVDVVRELEQAGAGADDMMAIFGQRAGPAMAALVGQGSVALEDMVKKLEESGGTAERIAGSQMKGSAGEFEKFRSAVDGLKLAIADSGFLASITSVITGLSDWVLNLSEANPEMLKFGVTVAGAVAVLGPLVYMVGMVASGLGLLLSPIGLVIAAIVGIVYATNKWLGGWSGIKKRMSSLWSFIKGGFVAMKDAIVGVFSGIWDAITGIFTGATNWIGKQINRLTGILPKWAQNALGVGGDVKVEVVASANQAARPGDAARPKSPPPPPGSQGRISVDFNNLPAGSRVQSQGEGIGDLDVGYAMEEVEI